MEFRPVPAVPGDGAPPRTLLATVAGALLLAAGVAGTFVAADALAEPAPAPVLSPADPASPANPAPVGVARTVPTPPAVPGSMPSVSAEASCTVLAAGSTARTVSVTVTYTVTGGSYRLGAADGPLHEGDSWTTSSTTERTSPAGLVGVPNLLAASAFTPSGTYLGVVSGPDTTTLC